MPGGSSRGEGTLPISPSRARVSLISGMLTNEHWVAEAMVLWPEHSTSERTGSQSPAPGRASRSQTKTRRPRRRPSPLLDYPFLEEHDNHAARWNGLIRSGIPSVGPPPTPARAGTPPVALLGVAFDDVTLAGALKRIEDMVASGRPRYIVTANVDFLVQAKYDVELRRILLEAHLVLCDGTPLVWASRLLGHPLAERVAGSDLVPLLLPLAAEKGYRLFFLGASPESNEEAAANVRALYPQAKIAGHYSPPFRPLLEMDHEEIAQRIRAARPDLPECAERFPHGPSPAGAETAENNVRQSWPADTTRGRWLRPPRLTRARRPGKTGDSLSPPPGAGAAGRGPSPPRVPPEDGQAAVRPRPGACRRTERGAPPAKCAAIPRR